MNQDYVSLKEKIKNDLITPDKGGFFSPEIRLLRITLTRLHYDINNLSDDDLDDIVNLYKELYYEGEPMSSAGDRLRQLAVEYIEDKKQVKIKSKHTKSRLSYCGAILCFILSCFSIFLPSPKSPHMQILDLNFDLFAICFSILFASTLSLCALGLHFREKEVRDVAPN